MFLDVAGSTSALHQGPSLAAARRLTSLLDELIGVIAEHGGRVIKSDGDDLLAIFEPESICMENAASVAILAQRLAAQFGFSLYVGLHRGEIELRDIMGRKDVFGAAVNMAARLHKLVPDMPGHIFLTSEMAATLSEDKRSMTRPYGQRHIKGIGLTEIATLDWMERYVVHPTVQTRLGSTSPSQGQMKLVFAAGFREVRLADSPLLIGRGLDCAIRLDDPESKVSSHHVRLVAQHDTWLLKDVSRNGTCLRFAGSPDEIYLLGDEIKLVRSGEMCLARHFAQDPQGRFHIRFFFE